MKLLVYSRRHGHNDTYQIAKTRRGWSIRFMGIEGEGDKSGYPVLHGSLQHDWIKCPLGVGERLAALWDKAGELGMDETTIQQHLDALGAYMQTHERDAQGHDYHRRRLRSRSRV